MTEWRPHYRVVMTTAASAPADSRAEARRLYQAGLGQLQSNRLAEAEQSFARSLALDSDFLDAHVHLGVVLQALLRHSEAIHHYERALALRPDDVGTLNNLGTLLLALNRPHDAVRQYAKAVALAPELAEVHVNLANALHHSGRHDEAFQHYSQALAIAPGFARAHMNLGNFHEDLIRYPEAIRCYEQALAIEPDYVAALMNLGTTLQLADRRSEAIEFYEKVLVLEPGNADARLNLGILYLSLGRLAEGWKNYEHRWAAGHRGPDRGYQQPRWNGERVKGTLLIWAEQGIGDQILHAGMIPDLSGRADSIVLEVEPRLVPLLARSFPGLHVIGLDRELYVGPVNAHESLAGIARFLRPSLDDFPHLGRGYLIADEARAQALRQRLISGREIVVGLSWISRNPEFGRMRSARLRDFEALLQWPGCRFVDLQYGDTQAERVAVERETGVLIDRLDDIDNTNDIDGLATLISACDLVVTVDNTTVHLAGALGKPTWVLVPHGPARIWYWFDGRDDSPWYPHVRVQRQRNGQSWAELIRATANDIGRSIYAIRSRPA